MILAQNRRPLLSGNRLLAFLVIPLLLLVSCGAFIRTAGNNSVPSEENAIVVNPEIRDVEVKTPPKEDVKEDKKTEFTTVYFRGERFKVPSHKQTFEIAVLLPFHITGANNYQDKKRANYMLEYYQGMKLAIDEIEQLGSRFRIKLYDTDNDTMVLKQILRKPELKKVDLIIGPTDEKQVKIASYFAKNHEIPLFSPITTVNKYWSNNPYIFNLRPSHKMQAQSFITFYQNLHKNKKLIIVRDGKRFDKTFGAALVSELQNQNIAFTKIALDNITSWETLLTDSAVVFCTAQDKTNMTNMVNSLLAYDEQVTLVGSDKWLDFSSVDFNYWERLNIHFISENSAQTLNQMAVDMTKRYRLEYKGDPSWFAFRGYDQLLFACESLDAFGNYFPIFLENKTFAYSNSNFCLTKSDNCIQNKYIQIFKYHEKEVIPVLVK